MRSFILPLLAISFALIAGFKTSDVHNVKGTIRDENGNSLAGVSVMEKGGRNGTTSTSDGSYSISVNDGSTTLVFAYIGHVKQEVEIKGQAVINVVMKTSIAKLEEVVITSYDSQSLQGRVAGIAINGNAASARKMRIRGATTFGYYSNNDFDTEAYDPINENAFHRVADDPLSTFSIDVDAASYSNVRRFLNNNQRPPAGAVRTEEMINYFSYSYPQPTNTDPFSINTEMSDCPWNTQHKLVLIGLQGKKIPVENLPSSNLVFLIDVSGSMQDALKLPLVKSSMKLLTDQLREQDKISIVVYAGNAGLVLPATSGANKTKIKEAIDALEAGGSTAGGQGIKLAYKVAKENFTKEGNNRVILCTDGDFNIGASSNDEMEKLIEQERKSGIFLTVLGYGMGNYKDSKMQILADKGNGNHAYIDGMSEARKVLVNEFGGTLFTIAKDVKIQVEFNPFKVQGYRLIGYENRMLNKEDFNDDKKDAGELGSGHTVTAMYEIIPAGVKDTFLKDVDPLKYQKKTYAKNITYGEEMVNVKLRYKAPDGDKSLLIEQAISNKGIAFANASENFRFASCIAEFGMLLRNSDFKSNASFNHVFKTAKAAKGTDAEGYRKEFIALVKKASVLKSREASEEDDDDDDVVLNN
ncbi:MAG: YfbK domain-containing protein [Flavisolibacter sp.]